MGMNSAMLSRRARQPGHDRTFRTSEKNFVEALKKILDPNEWMIEDHPDDLRRFISGKYGIIPEASIEFLPTGRKFSSKSKNKIRAETQKNEHVNITPYSFIRRCTNYSVMIIILFLLLCVILWPF